MLLDEVFGESNFVGSIAWQRKYAVAGDDAAIASMHDHILVYARTSAFARNLLPRSKAQDDRHQNPDNDPRGP